MCVGGDDETSVHDTVTLPATAAAAAVSSFFILPSASQHLPSHPALLALECEWWWGGSRASIRLLFALSNAFIGRGEPAQTNTHKHATD